MDNGVAIPPYHDLHVAVMGHELPPQQGDGWLEPASDPFWGVYRWTTGRAHLHLYAVPGPQRLCLQVGVPIRALAKTLAVQVNGRTVWCERLSTGAHLLKIDLPPEAARGDILSVSLLSRRTVPAHWEGGPDRRALGVLVQRVWVESAGAEEFRPAPLGSPLRDAWLRLWAGRREANPARVGGPVFWLWAGPALVFSGIAGLALRCLRAFGIHSRASQALGPVSQETSDGSLWRPAPQDDALALSLHLQSLREGIARGRWGAGSALSAWMGRLWRRIGPGPGQRVLAVGRAAPQTAELVRARFGAAVAVIDDSPSGAHALRVATGGQSPQILGDVRSWPIGRTCVDVIDLTEDALASSEWERIVKESARALRPGGRLIVRASSAERAWTWHALAHRLTGGRLGHGAEAPEPHAVQAAWLRRVIEGSGLKVDHVARTHAVFTQILDEWLGGRPAPRWAVLLAQLADEPWLWAGQSARIALIAHRPGA